MSQMMTFGDLKQNIAFDTLNVCPDDDRFKRWVNAAQEQMLNQGRWWGTVREIQICATEGCIVLPREVATIEQIAICGQPIPFNSQWYQFTRLLAKISKCDSGGCASGSSCNNGVIGACGHVHAEDRSQRVSFAVTKGSDKKIRAYLGSLSDVGKKIIIQGYDKNNIWVRTVIDGVMSDGEQITLASPFVDTVTTWGPGNPLAVIKDKTAQRVLLYSVSTEDGSELALANYQPSETRPMYRSLFIPNFSKIKCHGCAKDTDGNLIRTVNAIVSLQHVPVDSDNDWMIFQNLQAYQLGIQAAKAYQEGNSVLGNAYMFGTPGPSRNGRGNLRVLNRGGAIPMLQAELRKMTGDRVETFVYMDETNRPIADMRGFR